jgi:hypothetical protein
VPIPPQSDEAAVWGKYPDDEAVARFESGRRFWSIPVVRARLLAQGLEERHPQCDRFMARRTLPEEVLASTESCGEMVVVWRRRGTTLRCVTRDIPAVFGSFFAAHSS